MEGGGGAQGQQQGEGEAEKAAGRQPRAAGMKFRVSARAPHGAGALLLIGGAVLAGAAVVAWRHATRRGERDDRRQPVKKEVSGGGVAEDGKGAASAREIDPPDDNLKGEEEKTEIGSKGLHDNDRVAEEIQEVRDDAEIVDEDEVVADESDSKRAENFELDSSGSPVAISMHDDVDSERAENFDLDSGGSPVEIPVHDDVDSERVEKFDVDSSAELPEITTRDMDTVTVEKGDEDSTKNNTEKDNNSTKNDIESDQDAITNGTENEDSSKNDLKEEIAPNDSEDVEEASDQSSHGISRPGILLDKESLQGCGAQEPESMENSPTTKQMVHQEHLSDDTAMDTEGDASEPNPGRGAALDADVHGQGQEKAAAEPVGLAGSPALSSPVKPAEKKEPKVQGRIETGMKIEQDYTNGGLKERGLVTKGVTPGGAPVVTMDRRSSPVAVLALLFALTIGIAIVVRLYAPLQRATKLDMDLQ